MIELTIRIQVFLVLIATFDYSDAWAMDRKLHTEDSRMMTSLYIHILSNSIEIGEYDNQTLQSKPYRKYALDCVNEKEVIAYLSGDESKNILYYIHCWKGNIGFYNRSSLQQIRLFEGIDKTISIIWEAPGLMYKRSWNQARSLGQEISILFSALVNSGSKNNFMLCHSMGHSFFLGLKSQLNYDQPAFKLIIFAGADLPQNVFENELADISSLAEQIVVYTHQKDRLLQISGFLHGGKRLGAIQPDKQVSYQNNTKVVFTDITDWPGNHSIIPANHAYFKDHDGVRTDITRWIKIYR